MQGTKIDDLYEYLSNGHEISFTYNGIEYSMEPETDAFTIWEYGKTSQRICRYAILESCDIKAAILDFLNTKCFDGKSFMEIEKDVVVDVIY